MICNKLGETLPGALFWQIRSACVAKHLIPCDLAFKTSGANLCLPFYLAQILVYTKYMICEMRQTFMNPFKVDTFSFQIANKSIHFCSGSIFFFKEYQ
jgi:hypothetical protein